MKKLSLALLIATIMSPAAMAATAPEKAKVKPAQVKSAPAKAKAAPAPVRADIPEINTLKSYIRDDYRQLAEDKANGDIEAIRITEEQILIDKEMLKNAYEKHGLKYHDNAWTDRSDRVAEPANPKVDILPPQAAAPAPQPIELEVEETE